MVPETVSHFIGGRHVHSSLRKTYGVTDPATGKEYAQVEVGMGADVNQAVLAARAALETGPWPGMAAPDRARILHGIADAIDARAGDIAAAEGLGPGLPVTQATEQAARAGGVFRVAADLITARAGTAEACAPGGPGSVLASPAGIAGLITPWRTPFLAQARALAPALAAGCTVVLKPDEWAPLPAALLAEITTAAGLPDGVLNIVHGSLHRRAPGAQARDALIAHPSVARLWFEGEAATGRQIVLDAATHRKALCHRAGRQLALPHLRRRRPGPGDRQRAVRGVRAQRPATHRHLDHPGRAPGLRHPRQPPRPAGGPHPRRRPGRPGDAARSAAARRALRPALLLGAARDQGRRVAGGRRPAAAGLPEGNYLGATVLGDVAPSMQIFAEPVCGPVVRVTPFDTEDEAISLANAVTDPTAAYIWTCDLQRAHRLAPAIASPSTWVNSHNRQDRQPAVGSDGPGRPGARSAEERRHRLLHALPDRAHRGRRHAGAAVRRLSGAAQPADRSSGCGRGAG